MPAHHTDEAKKIIKNVYDYCKLEKTSTKLLAPLSAPLYRAAAACNVSVSTVYRSQQVENKPKDRKPRQDRRDIDDFDRGVIRRTVHSMYTSGNMMPTLHSIRAELESRLRLVLVNTRLSKELRSMGFKYKRCKSNRKVLMERQDVVLHRIRYLRALQRYRAENRPIIFMDETYNVCSFGALCQQVLAKWGGGRTEGTLF